MFRKPLLISAALILLTGISSCSDHQATEACRAVLNATNALKKKHINPDSSKLLLQLNHSLLQFAQAHKISIGKKDREAGLPKKASEWISACGKLVSNVPKNEKNYGELAIELLSFVMKHWDPHSLAVSSETLSAVTSLTEGYGFKFEREDQTAPLDIIDVVAGSPAHNAGLQEGAQVWTIEGQNVSEMKTQAIYAALNSPKKDTIRLGVKTLANEPLKRYTIVRGRFETSPIKFESLRLLDSKFEPFDVGYVRFRSFVGSQAFFAEALKSLRKTSTSLILDLRNISGGEIRSVATIADHLIPNLIELVGFKCSGAKSIEPVQLVEASSLWDVPIIVLVNSATKSAAEILAAALQDYGAVVVGTRTFGKGTQQSLVSLQEFGLNGAAFVTDAFTIRPSGRFLQLEGITPDVPLPSLSTQKYEYHYPHYLSRQASRQPLYGFDKRNLFAEIHSLKPALATFKDSLAQKTMALMTTTNEEEAYLKAAEAVAVFLKEHSDVSEDFLSVFPDRELTSPVPPEHE